LPFSGDRNTVRGRTGAKSIRSPAHTTILRRDPSSARFYTTKTRTGHGLLPLGAIGLAEEKVRRSRAQGVAEGHRHEPMEAITEVRRAAEICCLPAVDRRVRLTRLARDGHAGTDPEGIFLSARAAAPSFPARRS